MTGGPDGTAPRPRPRPRRIAAAVAAVAALLAVAGPGAAPAGATADGGASTRVTRDGRIITWILFPDRRPSRPAGTAPTSVWVTLGDPEIAFLLHLVAARPELSDDPLVGALAAAAAGAGPDVELQLLVVGGAPTTQVRVVPVDPAADAAPAVLARRMVTVLPVLTPTVTPPAGAVIPVGVPVFVSFDADQWSRAVDRTLTAGGVSARVRARPVGFALGTGDPADVGRVLTCDGPGRPYDPADPASPLAQARRPGTCAQQYRTATGVRGRRGEWFADLTVWWRAEWTADGTTWRSLGLVPRLSVLRRRVGELGTAVEAL